MPADKTYTIQDLESWDDGGMYELIDSELYYTHGGKVDLSAPTMMAPAPSGPHQEITGNLFRQIDHFLEGKPCKVIPPPYAVYLNVANDVSKEEKEHYVIPDLVVCDQNKRQKKGCVGAPAMVVEILSPSTASKDRTLKQQLYRDAGTPEYWIIEPESKTILAGRLVGTEYSFAMRGVGHNLDVHVLDGCVIDVGKVFDIDE